MTRGRAAFFSRCAAAALAALAASGCARPLPEAASADARLYVERCGTCHVPHHPHTLTAAMWQVQVQRMDSKFRGAGMAPPQGPDREKILAYLTRNAGG